MRAAAAAVVLLSARLALAQQPQPPAEDPPARPTRLNCRSLFRACIEARDPDRLPVGGDAFQRGRARDEQRRARQRVVGALFELELGAADFAFQEYDFDDQLLAVDTTRNIRLWGGRMALYPAGGDAIAFPLPPDRAREIVARHRRRGVKLRIGFMLGHDDPDADPCLLRPGVAPIVRADLAYYELSDESGHILAREDTPRLADAHTLAPEPVAAGNATHVSIAPATVTGDRALAAAIESGLSGGGADRLAEAMRSCVRVDGPTGTIVVDVAIDATGHASDAQITVDSIHEESTTRCVRDAVLRFTFAAGPRHARGRVSVPVMLTRD